MEEDDEETDEDDEDLRWRILEPLVTLAEASEHS